MQKGQNQQECIGNCYHSALEIVTKNQYTD